MKAKQAIRKIYLHPTVKGNVGASWLRFPLTDDDIEYTRTDAFIEKACEYLQINLWRVVNEEHDFRQRFVTDFKNYMKGE